MGDKTWNIGKFQICIGIYLILYENIKIVSGNTNLGLKVD